jgi:hypothetical protein
LQGVYVSSFDVRVFAIRRRPGRKAFEVRWRVAGRDKSRSFVSRALLPRRPRRAGALARAQGRGGRQPGDRPSPAQVRVILAGVARIRPEPAAFFGCLYYPALGPEEAVALRRDDLILPARGRGPIILTAACPRTGSAWTSTGTPFEPRGLKHRPGGAIRVVPIPPSARTWPPPRWPAAPMTCGTPPCRCG